MSLKKILTLILCICTFLTFLSGCMLFQKTEFKLLSSEIIDDGGFPSLFLDFNTSDTVILKLLSPKNAELFSDEYYRGDHQITIALDDYRHSPDPGNYTLKAFDTRNTVVYENELSFKGGSLIINKITDYWWHHDTTYALVGLNVTFYNQGDLPMYPSSCDTSINSDHEKGLLTPVVVLPMQSQKTSCFVYIDSITAEQTILSLTIDDTDNQELMTTTKNTTPSNMINDIIYTWNYERKYELKLPDVQFLYSYYHNRDRFVIDDYCVYIFDPYDDSYVKLLCNQLKANIDYSDNVDIVNYVASFVQNLNYAEDSATDPTVEYPRFPVEMLTDKQGDCEDKSILAASLLDEFGYNVSLIRLPNHMAVGVHLDDSIPAYSYFEEEYYFLETTRNHWNLGRIPEEYQTITNATLYQVSDRPILLHSWENATHFTEGDTEDFVKLNIIVDNLGRATAYQMVIRGGFYDNNSRVYNEETTTISSLAPETKTQVKLFINVPRGVSTVLKTRVYLKSVMVHEKESTDRFS
jgi:hypothetical protein